MNPGNRRHYGTLLLLIYFGIISGCNSTRQVQIGDILQEGSGVPIPTFNDDVRDRDVAIKFDQEYEYKTHGVSMSGDSLQYTDTTTGLPTKIHWQEVRFVRCKDRLGGALDMALFSIPLAVLVGVDKGGFGGEVRKGGGVEGALITVGAGAVIGFAIGHDYLYYFNNADEER